MANYSLVINSKFRPFTYDELMKPAREMTEAHQEIEAAYGALDTQASKWEHMANQATDGKAYTMYSNYAKDLRAQADNLAKNGLNAMSRKDLLNMQRRYAQEITPIENAYTRRAELADEQRKLRIQDNSIRFQKDAGTMSLQDFIDNPMADYGASYSGAALAKQAGELYSSFAKSLRNYAVQGTTDPYTNAFIAQTGYTPEEVTQFLHDLEHPDSPNHGEAFDTFSTALESVIDTSGVRSWNDEAALKDAYNWAAQGAYKAIGETKVSPMDNFGAQLWAKEESTRRLRDEAAGIEEAKKRKAALANIRTRSIFSSREKDEMDARQKDAESLKDLFNEDAEGNYSLKPEMREGLMKLFAMNKAAIEGTGKLSSGYTGMDTRWDTDLGKLMKMGITQETLEKMSNEEVGQIWSDYYNSKIRRPDGTKYTEFYYPIHESVREDARDLILSAAGGLNAGKLSEVDFNPEETTYKPTGKTYTIEDILKADYLPIDTGYSEHGLTVTFRNEDGENKDIIVEMPIIDDRRYAEMLELIAQKQQIQSEKAAGNYKTWQEMKQAEDSMNAIAYQLFDNMSGMLISNKPKPFETSL